MTVELTFAVLSLVAALVALFAGLTASIAGRKGRKDAALASERADAYARMRAAWAVSADGAVKVDRAVKALEVASGRRAVTGTVVGYRQNALLLCKK